MTTETRIVDPLIAELEQEGKATLRMLERVPADKLTWKPHEKSMSLGQLALHVASAGGGIANFLEADGLDVTTVDFDPAQPDSKEEILAAFSAMQATAREKLEALGNDGAMSEWRMTKGDELLSSMPKIGLARALMFNHVYHHRGQLSVYLRLLDVPVPATYGRSADESQFN